MKHPRPKFKVSFYLYFCCFWINVTQISFENIKRKIQRIISDSCFQLKSWLNVDARAHSIPLLNFPFNEMRLWRDTNSPYLAKDSEGTRVFVQVDSLDALHLPGVLDVGAMATDGQTHQVFLDGELLNAPLLLLLAHLQTKHTVTSFVIIIIIDINIAHIAEASKRLETEGRVEMTWDDVNYIIQDNTYIEKI